MIWRLWSWLLSICSKCEQTLFVFTGEGWYYWPACRWCARLDAVKEEQGVPVCHKCEWVKSDCSCADEEGVGREPNPADSGGGPA